MNRRFLCFAYLSCLALLFSLAAAGAAGAQTVTYDSSIRPDFVASHSRVPAGGTLAGGWTDLQGDIYSVAGDSLQAVSADANGLLYDLALRPAFENAAPNVQGTIYVLKGIPQPNTANGIVLRFQPDRTFYLFQLSQDRLYIYKTNSGRSAQRLQAGLVQPNTTHPYSLTASAVNVSGGVQLSVSATDLRTGKSIGSLSTSDVSSPIFDAGRAGIDSWVGDNLPGTASTSYARVVFSQLPNTPVTTVHATPKIGFIGDSITSGYNQVGRTITPGVNDAAALTIKQLSRTSRAAQADAGVAWSAYDQGISGSSTADWRPGEAGRPEAKAKAAFASVFGQPDPKANPVWVLVMLGTNDARSDHRFTAKKHRQNLLALTADLVRSGYNVILNAPPSFVVPTRFNGVAWDAASMKLLRSYLPVEQSLAASFAKTAPNRVFAGDISAFRIFAARPKLLQEYGVSGGLHPNGNGGTEVLAAGWARAFLKAAH